METTNVTAAEVNYHHYSTQQYDRDIGNAIPFHDEIHQELRSFFMENWESSAFLDILDLGVGTGLTSKIVMDLFPYFRFTVVDFSETMMAGARGRLGTEQVEYVLADYAKEVITVNSFDVVMSVIGLHHQTDVGKLAMFTKIRKALSPENGVFIFGDLVTFRDPQKAATEAARHYHHLVEKAADEKTLGEWAHHHMFLNQLAPLEDQLEWLGVAGFTDVQVRFQQYQTALIIAR